MAACTSGDGVPPPRATPPSTSAPTTTTGPTTTASAVEVTVRGTVAGVFASARALQLNPPVNGIENVALTNDTQIVRAGGARATLGDITATSTIEAVGRVTTPGTLLARKITLLS